MEHRKEKRVKLLKTLVFNPNNVCELENISRGGLSFKSYKGVVWPEKWNLDIITSNREFDIGHCPVELVWMKAGDKLISSSMVIEKVGVKFGDLDTSQKKKLNHILSSRVTLQEINLYR
jgi:hypothetical protein